MNIKNEATAKTANLPALKENTSPTPASLLELAITKGVDMAQLKELMDLQERWENKESKKKFLEALSKFQTLVPVLKKTKTANIRSQNGPGFQYRYADLGSITGSIKDALNECGLSYRWGFEESNDKLKVTCFISHINGHTESTTMEAGKDGSGSKNQIQQTGSTQTYLQRYTLIGALGLSTADADDDGNKDNSKRSDEDFLDQWQQVVDAVGTKVELTSLYLKNKKAVDSDKKIQAIFKKKEDSYKKNEKAKQSEGTVMP